MIEEDARGCVGGVGGLSCVLSPFPAILSPYPLPAPHLPISNFHEEKKIELDVPKSHGSAFLCSAWMLVACVKIKISLQGNPVRRPPPQVTTSIQTAWQHPSPDRNMLSPSPVIPSPSPPHPQSPDKNLPSSRPVGSASLLSNAKALP